MKRAALVLSGLAIAALASAQLDNGSAKLRVGAVYPFENSTRKTTGNMIGVGIDYTLAKSLLPKGETFLNFDWFGKSGSGAKGNIFPFMINQKWFTDEKRPAGNRPYIFLGAGFANVDVTKAKIVYAGRAGIGAELNEKVSFDVILTVSDKAGLARANSIGVYFGYKF